jgi:WD40 repeat protein
VGWGRVCSALLVGRQAGQGRQQPAAALCVQPLRSTPHHAAACCLLPLDAVCLPAGHESWVLSVSAHPRGTAFATGSSDSKVKLWDLQTRTCAQVGGGGSQCVSVHVRLLNVSAVLVPVCTLLIHVAAAVARAAVLV